MHVAVIFQHYYSYVTLGRNPLQDLWGVDIMGTCKVEFGFCPTPEIEWAEGQNRGTAISSLEWV